MNMSVTPKLALKALIAALPGCLVTFTYVGKAYHDAGHQHIDHYEAIPLLIPALFTVFNTLRLLNPSAPAWQYGAGLGLTLSAIGRFRYQLPAKLFGFTEENEWRVHVWAVVVYGLIFHWIVDSINKKISIR